jgi:cell division protease FtsH
MSVLLGGRAAEQIVFGHLSTGAADDLARTTDIARSMVTRYGMVPELGHVAYDTEQPAFLRPAGVTGTTRTYGEQTAQAIDAAVRDLVRQAYDAAAALLARHRDTLERGARNLLEVETLDEPRLQALFVDLGRDREMAREPVATA